MTLHEIRQCLESDIDCRLKQLQDLTATYRAAKADADIARDRMERATRELDELVAAAKKLEWVDGASPAKAKED